MTQHPQHPQQEEYIITFDELKELKPDVAEGMYKSTKEKKQEQIIFRVLSRPHTTPASHQRIEQVIKELEARKETQAKEAHKTAPGSGHFAEATFMRACGMEQAFAEAIALLREGEHNG